MNQAIFNGQVSAGCLLFTPHICAGHTKKDIEDLILYTQLAATKKHSRFSDADGWKKRWIEALVQFGAAMSSHVSLSLPAASLERATPWEWLIQGLPAFMASKAMADCEGIARRSFGTVPHQPAVEMLSLHVLETRTDEQELVLQGAQRVGVQFCVAGPTSSLELAILTFTHRTSLPANFLFSQLAPADVVGNVEMSFYSMRLMELVYVPFREKIDALLTNRRAQAVSPLMGVTHEH